MFSCIFIKRKLYDYLDHALSGNAAARVRKHIDACPACRGQLEEMRVIVEMAGQKRAPEPNGEFWHKFQVDLDRKLNERLVTPVDVKKKRAMRLVPAYAYAGVLAFLVIMSGYLYPYITFPRQDRELVAEIISLDTVDNEFVMTDSEEAITQEVNILYELGQI
ncbi:MAG: zf-HC2 domain-containing protein [Candidatus Omnitrophota bacterium]